jgi:hypothetical protein
MQTNNDLSNAWRDLKFIFSVLLHICFLSGPFLVTATYKYLPWHISFSVYCFSMGLAVCPWEKNFGIRILVAFLTVVLAAGLECTFDVIRILGLSILLGLLCGPFFYKRRKMNLSVYVIYRLIRAGVALVLAFLALMIPIEGSGNCPAGGGDIFEAFWKLLTISYVLVVGLFICDSVYHLVIRRRLSTA